MNRLSSIILALSLIVLATVIKVNIFPEKNITSKRIIINAMPKSASEYLTASIAGGLKYKVMSISSGYIPYDQIIYDKFMEFVNTPGAVTKQHLDPSVLNTQYLKSYSDRIVVNLRDPRAVLLSWVYHVDKYLIHENETGDSEKLYRIQPKPPRWYTKASLDAKVDWNIEHFLPAMLIWIDGWTEFAENESNKKNGVEVLFTTYEELVENEDALYKRICKFYNIDFAEFTPYKVQKTYKVNFRKGQIDEWREVFSEEQVERINAMISPDMLKRFNWKK